MGLVDGHLHDALDVELHRVFGGEELGIHRVDSSQRGIQRRCFAAASGPGYNDNPVRLLDRLAHVIVNELWEAECLQVEVHRRTIENTQHHRLAKLRGQSGNTQVHLATGNIDGDAAVLRKPALRDVQIRHDLKARGHG